VLLLPLKSSSGSLCSIGVNRTSSCAAAAAKMLLCGWCHRWLLRLQLLLWLLLWLLLLLLLLLWFGSGCGSNDLESIFC
jgi:hypothetical protein